ncbi:hypothetical protein [Pelagibaculum spongiae]|uniref:Uncharacterized protein n=1 Tax=Pelagibaculum spongiae TaxID=2080658 RepID=A0A2V1GY59_9GAMM|nr:hypothetical protein [Pelagibaculum spongiae]PVZ69575.1 hypothetical protein DC094_09670 [Pelagibaculum spongiae]
MHLTLEAKKGAPPFFLGAKRDDIKQLLLPAIATTHLMEPENDFYEGEGLILGYDSNENLEYIEILKPNLVEFESLKLFSLSAERIISALKELGHEAPYNDGGYIFKSIGIALYCPMEKIESVSIFQDGYYD